MTICVLSSAAKSDIIVKVYDGDTVTTSSGEKIRLACIDAPEIKTNKHEQYFFFSSAYFEFIRKFLKNFTLRLNIK